MIILCVLVAVVAGPPAESSARKSDPTAASLLKAAQNLEKLGKKAGSLEFYAKVAREYSDSAEATTAKARIFALGGRVPAPSPRPAKRTAPTPAKASPPT